MVADTAPMLVLLNGPPASGKSTLADCWCAARPLALSLDVDVVRGQLGAWLDTPNEAGLAARRLALAMARSHLEAGHPVVVPQFLGRADFIVELAALAAEVDVAFHEVVLVLDRAEALAAFEARRARPESQPHRDAAALVDATGGGPSAPPDPLVEMLDRFDALMAQRPQAVRVQVVRGDIETTLARLEAALATVDPRVADEQLTYYCDSMNAPKGGG